MSDPVEVTFQIGSDRRKFYRKKYELLVVACDPRNLYGACDYSLAEKAIFKRFVNLTFHTSLLKVTLTPGFEVDHGVILSPEALENPQGTIYAFRNETAKTLGLAKASELTENWVTVYQLQNYGSKPLTPKQFQQKLVQQLKTLAWWPYGQNYQITDTFTTPYFDHFLSADLINGLPWQLLNLQGKRKTIYAHASACFESVLDCWQYANMLVEMKKKLPADRDAPILILGAGASGMLWADMLQRKLKYKKVEILEVTAQGNSKIHTIVKNGPPPNQQIVCELGACYLSPAYDKFVEYLKPFLTGGNQRVALSNDKNFRAIVTTGQFPNWSHVPLVMAQGDYIIEKTMHDTGMGRTEAEGFVVACLGFYPNERESLMGSSQTDPMPRMQPQNTNAFLSKTFQQWLNGQSLIGLVGLLQYAYSAQGYGAIDKSPAYYGMIWITRAVTDGILAELTPGGPPVVTAWSKGWGDILRQMKIGKKIIYNAKVTKITRPN